TPAPRPDTHKARLNLEQLGERVVPAAVQLTPLVPRLTDGVLTVVGNNSGNVINVTLSNGFIKVLGRSFAEGRVTSIVIDGKGGSDTINVSESITKPTFLYGGSGVDTIRGGGGAD